MTRQPLHNTLSAYSLELVTLLTVLLLERLHKAFLGVDESPAITTSEWELFRDSLKRLYAYGAAGRIVGHFKIQRFDAVLFEFCFEVGNGRAQVIVGDNCLYQWPVFASIQLIEEVTEPTQQLLLRVGLLAFIVDFQLDLA